MLHDFNDYEVRARAAERLALAMRDPVLREDILSLSRVYRDYALHLRERPANSEDAAWGKAANG